MDEVDIRDLVKSVDLLEYASNVLEFKKVNDDSYVAHCTLHGDDKNPSLYIVPSKQFWYCFGCGKGGDIIDFMEAYEGYTFCEALKKLQEITGKTLHTSSTSVRYLQKLQRMSNNVVSKAISREYQDYERDYARRFTKQIPQLWLDEGIKADVMQKFDVRMDISGQRIVYPVYDNDGRFITAKGRTMIKGHTPKYINYSKIGTTDFFAGMNVTRPYIEEEKKIIIVEGIKSVYKLFGWGFPYSAAAETSRINDAQIKILLQMHLNEIIIAFDNDQPFNKVLNNIGELKRFANVSVVFDREGLLPYKSAPVDGNLDTWEKLFNNRERIT